VAIKAQKKWTAPTTVNLEALLAQPPDKRKKHLEDQVDRKLTDTAVQAVKGASSLEDLHAALASIIDRGATPDLVPRGAMVLQPSEERRRSGSHYTPRLLTEPIVRTTLEPILSRLRGEDGRLPTPDQILDLKVCDPAMGSGAFLVEACRQLGDALIEAWSVHGGRPEIPSDEDEVVFARRPNAAYMVWTETRWLWIWPRSPCGSLHLHGSTPLPSSTTPSAMGTRSLGFPASRSRPSIGIQMPRGSRQGSR